MTLRNISPPAGDGEQRFGNLLVSIDGPVAVLTMDRPEKLNAIPSAFWGQLCTALDHCAAARVRVAILTGSGDRAFSAGGDIDEFQRLQGEARLRAYQQQAMDAFHYIERVPFFVIAAVNGIAFGGGAELALAADFVIAADNARFALPEAALGLVPGFGAVRGPDVIGRQMTKFLIATGDQIPAARAVEIGLAQLVVPAGRLMEEALLIARRITSRSPNALRTAKRMVNRTMDEQDLANSVEEITALQLSEDRARGVAAFLAKRPPAFD